MFWLGCFTRLRRRGLLAYGAWLAASLMPLVVGLLLSACGMGLAAFRVLGAMLAALGPDWANSLQEFVPVNLLERVASIDLLASSGRFARWIGGQSVQMACRATRAFWVVARAF